MKYAVAWPVMDNVNFPENPRILIYGVLQAK
jgi:hypothetical protein